MIGRCELCLADNQTLIDSHILSRWVYAAVLNYDPVGGPNLVQVEDGRVGVSGKQASKHLLCRPCEDKLGAAETYVSGIRKKPDGTFPALTAAALLGQLGNLRLVDVSALDCAKILYFATSVIWRADVSNIEPPVHLGPAKEPIRQYLNGTAPFPADAGLVVTLLDPPANALKVDQLATLPETQADADHHTFAACGLLYRLVTAKVAASMSFAMPFQKRAIIDSGDKLARAVAEETLTSTNYGSLARKFGK